MENRISDLIARRLAELAPEKSLEEIASYSGFSVDLLEAIAAGRAKLQIDRARRMAYAIDTDPGLVLRLTLIQYLGEEETQELVRLLDMPATTNMIEIWRFLVELTGEDDPRLDDRLRTAIATAYRRIR